MKLITTIKELRQLIGQHRDSDQQIGFVPTMGALHDGHLSLVERAGKENEIVVVSIFVNPTQFNDPSDLERYPRTLENDLKLLSRHKCDYVFSPNAAEIYPEPDTRKFDFGDLGTVMEGEFRPGHFNGVAQVVSKLFEIVNPDRAYFGLKDFQQLAVINNLVKQLDYKITIVPCEIVREADGLAMSSRNALLKPEFRKEAPIIRQTLLKAKELAGNLSVNKLKDWVVNDIESNSNFKVEYFDIVDGTKLQTINNWSEHAVKVGCIAVYAGEIRLIDNIIFDK